jgi:hypothetical protein
MDGRVSPRCNKIRVKCGAVRVHKLGYFPADLLVLDASTPSEVRLDAHLVT